MLRNQKTYVRTIVLLAILGAIASLAIETRSERIVPTTHLEFTASSFKSQEVPKYSYFFAIGECPLFAFCSFNVEQANAAKAKCEARFGRGQCVTYLSSGIAPKQNCEIIYPDTGGCEERKKPDDRPYSYYVGQNIFCLWVPFHEGDKEGEESARDLCKRCNKGEDCKVNRLPQATPACTYDCDAAGESGSQQNSNGPTLNETIAWLRKTIDAENFTYTVYFSSGDKVQYRIQQKILSFDDCHLEFQRIEEPEGYEFTLHIKSIADLRSPSLAGGFTVPERDDHDQFTYLGFGNGTAQKNTKTRGYPDGRKVVEYQNRGGNEPLYIQDAKMAERVIKALDHAATLCRQTKSTEPF